MVRQQTAILLMAFSLVKCSNQMFTGGADRHSPGVTEQGSPAQTDLTLGKGVSQTPGVNYPESPPASPVDDSKTPATPGSGDPIDNPDAKGEEPHENVVNTPPGPGKCTQEGRKDYHLRGKSHDETLRISKSASVKITGTHNKLHLIVDNPEEKIEEICIFLAGNVAEIDVELASDVGAIHYKGRGNLSRSNITANQGVSLDHIFADMAGNQPFLHLSENIDCDTTLSAIDRNGRSRIVCDEL